MDEQNKNIEQKNQEESVWKKYFSGWNFIINALIAFIPASIAITILREMGFGGALVIVGILYGFIYLAGLLREKISKKGKKVTKKTEKVENEKVIRNNKPKNKKTIWIVILLIGVGAFIFFSILNNQQKSTDENLTLTKTDKEETIGNLYRNNQYKFRIKFPEGWDIKSGDGPNILQKAVSGNHTLSVGVREIPAEFGDKTATIKDIITLAEFKDTLLQGVQEKFSGVKLLGYGESKIDNEPAYWIKYTALYTTLDITVQVTHVQYQLLKENIFYFISAGSASDEFSTAEPEFMKSIATFVTENY